MADLTNLGLDPNVKEAGSFTLLPIGKYEGVIISDGGIEENSEKTGYLIKLKCQITKGEYAGTELKTSINLTNPSIQCAAIGQGQMKKICSICKQPYPPHDTRRLWGIPMLFDIDQGEYNGKPTNKIKGYLPCVESNNQPKKSTWP